MSVGEILKVAAVDTVLGMGTVFLVLIFISIVIWAMGFVNKAESKKQEKAAAPVQKAAPAAATEPSTDDAQLVAVIMAAIKAYNGDDASADDDEYVVRSIRRATWKRTLSE